MELRKLLSSFYALATTCVLAAPPSPTADYVTGKAFDRFITIWLENQDYAAALEDAHWHELMAESISLTKYYAQTHPSQPNYLASVAGDYFGLNHDGFVQIPEKVSTVVDLFESKNISWKAYLEGVPGPGYMGEAATDHDGKWYYMRKHNPFVSFDSISMYGERLLNLQSLDAFQRDLKANDLPQYAFITPNMLNDGHNTSLTFSTSWSHDFLKPLLQNPYFMQRTLVLLTFDESSAQAPINHIGALLLGGAVPKSLWGSEDDTVYTHYSILSTLQNNWNLPNLGRYDVGANVFDVVARKTGYANSPPPNIDSITNSHSYPGYLNSDPAAHRDVPPPNLKLVGAGGARVDESVSTLWADASRMDSPYDGSGRLYAGGGDAPVYVAQAQNNLTVTTSGAEGAHGDGRVWPMVACLGMALAVQVLGVV